MSDPNKPTTATLQPDRKTIYLDEEIAVPPGKVAVSVYAPNTCADSGPTMLAVLERIQQEQVKSGRVSMTEEEMAKEIEELRSEDDEYEERWREIFFNHESSRDYSADRK